MTVSAKEMQTVAQDTDRSAAFFFLTMTRAIWRMILRGSIVITITQFQKIIKKIGLKL